jgi:hypothetical protein
MERYQQKAKRHRQWHQCASRERGMSPDQQRLTDLSLALIIPWRDYSQFGSRGWPQYWMNEQKEQQRMGEILIATDHERLPWEL